MGDCTVIEAGKGERFWLISDLITPLVGGNMTGGAYEANIADSLVNAGPPPHIHTREDEMFYVVEGEYQFLFENTTLRGAPGTCLFLPRGKVHTFAKVGEKPGRMIVIVTPAGFGQAAFAASQPCTDPTCPPQLSPTAMEKMIAACTAHGIEFKPEWKADQPFPRQPTPRELWVLGQHVKILLTSKETNGAFSVIENTSLTAAAVPVHIHQEQDEMFYVLEGTYEFDLPGGKLNATPGTFIYVPKKTPHGFRKIAGPRARFVDWHTPGGFERFFEGVGTVCTDIRTGPPTGPVDVARLVQVARECGMELV